MPAVTDLTWTQLNNALKQLTGENSNLITVDGYGVATAIDVVKVIGGFNVDPQTNDGMSTTTGVLKFVTRLHDACRIAQETANKDKAIGEKLTAFGAATAATPRGNLVPITRSLTSQADLSTAIKVVGTNA